MITACLLLLVSVTASLLFFLSDVLWCLVFVVESRMFSEDSGKTDLLNIYLWRRHQKANENAHLMNQCSHELSLTVIIVYNIHLLNFYSAIKEQNNIHFLLEVARLLTLCLSVSRLPCWSADIWIIVKSVDEYMLSTVDTIWCSKYHIVTLLNFR